MTPDESVELEIMNLATATTNKVVVKVDAYLGPERQSALERLQLRGWLRLIDVASINATHGALARIFVLSPAALKWRDDPASRNRTQPAR